MKVSSMWGVLVGCVALSACMYSPRAQSPMRAQVQVDVSSVWVCRSANNDRQWQRVPAEDADGHRRQGNRVSNTRQDEGQRCDNASDAHDRRGN
jgi:hypothetical protein